MKHLMVFLVIALAISCDKNRAIVNKFSDPVLIKIADFQDRRLSDSLYQFFKSPNPLYRNDAALAFASIQDTTATDKLIELLESEKDIEAQKAIVFALGQTGANFSETPPQAQKQVLREYFEALGKVAKVASNKLSPARALPDESSEDSVVLEGKVWGMYRLALRNTSAQYDSVLTKKAVSYLSTKFSLLTRLGAAHILSRGRMKDLSPYYSSLKAATEDTSPEVRMAVVLALRKVKNESVMKTLTEILSQDKDYRVRVNAVRAIQSYSFEQTKDILIQSFQDENNNVGIAASEVMKSIATDKFWKELVSLARSSKNWRVQANLYEAALYVNDNKELAEEIRESVKKSSNPYQRAALITALQQSVISFEFVHEQLLKADTPVVRSSAASALTSMNKHKKFQPALKKRFAEMYIEAMQTTDAAVIGIIAGALADSTLGYKSIIRDFTFLYDAKKKLSLPKDNEALQPLEAAIAYFEGNKNSTAVTNDFNHPINWELVKSISSDQKALIKTSKGNIVIRLFVEEAPGSVANFVELANQHYFDTKFFHRVVPNFVIQAGCNRGDGWGSEDYSIRSEFSHRRYKTGSVGMASAGKDTEGTQWFITHSPTPHLDGRYTIFAEVESGMDVVHQIEVGDQIISVTLINN